MTSAEIIPTAERIVHAPRFIGQATAVEQARAAAEVQAAVVVAQNVPRNLDEVIRRIRETCSQTALADRAFYRYSRGGQQISGPSVHLAREIKRCFGNFQSGVDELRRDDEAGESEVRAWAWDVEANARQSRTLIVPHAQDTKQGRKKLKDLRDIQEMIANQGARVERETILALVPKWLTEQAIDICNQTLKNGQGDKPMAQRIADTVQSFGDSYGISKEQLEDKLGRKSPAWLPQDLATLRVIWTSIQRGEVTLDEEFPPQRVTVDEITQPRPPATRGKARAKATEQAEGYEPTEAEIAAWNDEANAQAPQ